MSDELVIRLDERLKIHEKDFEVFVARWRETSIRHEKRFFDEIGTLKVSLAALNEEIAKLSEKIDRNSNRLDEIE